MWTGVFLWLVVGVRVEGRMFVGRRVGGVGKKMESGIYNGTVLSSDHQTSEKETGN